MRGMRRTARASDTRPRVRRVLVERGPHETAVVARGRRWRDRRFEIGRTL